MIEDEKEIIEVKKSYKEFLKDSSKGLFANQSNDNILFVPEVFKSINKETNKFKIPKEYWTLFEFKPLKQSQYAYMRPYINSLTSSKSGDECQEAYEKICELLDNSLIRVKNLYDGQTNLIEYKSEVGLENYITMGLAVEMCIFIMSKSVLSEDEKEGLTF